MQIHVERDAELNILFIGMPGVRLGSPAEVDEAYAALTAAGAEGHLEPWDAFWGMRYAMVHDPDGNGVDLFAPLS